MVQSVPYGSSLAETTYRPGVTLEAERRTFLSMLEGAGPEYAIRVIERPGTGRGETVVERFSVYQNRTPKNRDAKILGNEGSMSTVTDSLDLRYHSLDAAIDNFPADQNQVSLDLRDREMIGLSVEWAQIREAGILNHLCGNTDANDAASDHALTGGNAVVALDSASVYYSGKANLAAVGADSNAIFTTRTIDELVKRAGSKRYRSKWPIVPAKTPWGNLYICVVGPEGYQQCRENSASSDFYDLAKARIQGGDSYDESTFVTGEGFIYDRTVVLKSDFVPQGVLSEANTAWAAFFGAQAIVKVYGEGYTDGNHLGWSEHQQHRRLSILTDTICGFKRVMPNNEQSFGSIAVAHHQPSVS